MINEFFDDVPNANALRLYLATPVMNPFTAEGFLLGYYKYVQSIRMGRMLYVPRPRRWPT